MLGAKLNIQQKIEIVQQLKRLNVDIIEAGFPASSAGDFQAVREVARTAGDSVSVTALARAVKSDIDAVHRMQSDSAKRLYELASFQVISNNLHPTATVQLSKGGETYNSSAVGDGRSTRCTA